MLCGVSEVAAQFALALFRLKPPPARVMLGIAGPPGSGKSTLAAAIRDSVQANPAGGPAAVVSLDGFHLPNATLDAKGLRPRKGSPETFEVKGFVNLLATLRRGEAVRAPIYDRAMHEPSPGPWIDDDVRFVIVEGNYLLLGDEPWSGVRSLLDAVWYLDTPVETCMQRVRARHIAGGSDEAVADRKIR